MPNLDDPKTYQRIDPSGLGGRIKGLPSQCLEAWRTAQAFSLPKDRAPVERVLVLGMGGSAIGGEILGDLLSLEAAPPVAVHRDYVLPGILDRRTLIVASSYSGNTEETLSAFALALRTDAPKLVVTTGGKLKELAIASGVPVFTIDHRSEPRSAVGYGLFPLMAILQGSGVIADRSRDVEAAIDQMEALAKRLSPETPLQENPAKMLAKKVEDKVAVIYGAGFLSATARRWKTQLNENSKTWAFFELLPELDHNSVVGYEFPPKAKGKLAVLLLRSKLLHPRTLLRYDLTSEALAKAGIEHEIVEGVGPSVLSHVMTTILMGDFVSYYVAILNEIDPAPVSVIDHLKKRLADAG